jgi:hypothetical protein
MRAARRGLNRSDEPVAKVLVIALAVIVREVFSDERAQMLLAR